MPSWPATSSTSRAPAAPCSSSLATAEPWSPGSTRSATTSIQTRSRPGHRSRIDSVNAVAVDKHGVIYATSEDGNLYAIRQGGVLKQRIFLELAIGAAYTP